jgi:diadenosine tetraphosphate (Ap4A) HIT family hydrolase
MRKFGAPATVVRDYERWAVMLRPAQVSLGALVLVCKEAASAFSMLSPNAFAELRVITGDVEQVLQKAFGYDKINYLMLMMVDPDVHFHVIPRYADIRTFAGQVFHDPAWPGPPDLTRANSTDEAVNQAILDHIKELWP